MKILLISLVVLVILIDIIIVVKKRLEAREKLDRKFRETYKTAIYSKLRFLHTQADQEVFEYKEKLSNAQEYEKPTIKNNHQVYLRDLNEKISYLENEIKKLWNTYYIFY